MQLPNAILGAVPPPSMPLGPPPPFLPLPVAKTPLPVALDPPKLTQAELDKKLIAAQMAKLDRENARPSSSTTKIPDLSKPNAAKLPTHTPPPKVEPPRPPGGVPPPGPPAAPVRVGCPAAELTMQDYRPMMMLLARQMPMHGARDGRVDRVDFAVPAPPPAPPPPKAPEIKNDPAFDEDKDEKKPEPKKDEKKAEVKPPSAADLMKPVRPASLDRSDASAPREAQGGCGGGEKGGRNGGRDR